MEIVKPVEVDQLIENKTVEQETSVSDNGSAATVSAEIDVCVNMSSPPVEQVTVSSSDGVTHSSDVEEVHEPDSNVSETDAKNVPCENGLAEAGTNEHEEASSPEVLTCVDNNVEHCAENEQNLVRLNDIVESLVQSNKDLQTTLAAGNQKMLDLEAVCADLTAKNLRLEREVARLGSVSDKTTGDVVTLTSSVAPLLADRQAASDDAKAVDSTKVKQPTAEERIAELERKSEQSLTRFTEYATTLEHIENDLQRYLRRQSLIVENLCPKEDRSACDAFLVFINSVLGVTADESDIDGLHLVDKPSTAGTDSASGGSGSTSPTKTATEHRPRPVLITFTCFRTRTRVYKAWLSYRVGAAAGGKVAAGALSGERGQGVCIREYLTPSQETVYQSAIDVRHRRPDVVTDCWTFRGRTFVRTAQGDVREFTEAGDLIPKDDGKSSCLVM